MHSVTDRLEVQHRAFQKMDLRLCELGRLNWRIICLIVIFFTVLATITNQLKFGDLFRVPVSTDLSKLPNCPQNFSRSNKRERLMNTALMEYDASMRDRFEGLLSRNVHARDPELISLLRDFLDPPSDHLLKLALRVLETPQSSAVLEILKDKKDGFFVEAGGFNGERSSNTLYLEQKLGWTGLLVEMDPYFYTQLRGKNRKCWSINACIGPSDRPIKMNFKESSGGAGQLTSSGTGQSVPCFPLESMLLALNRSRVDYFSLDVEGYELDVLETIPYDRVDITTLSVEYVHGKRDKTAYRSFMEGKGYSVYKDIKYTDRTIGMYVNDYIFVKNSTLGSLAEQ